MLFLSRLAFVSELICYTKVAKKMGEILFLYITQPEEIRETENFFEWILLFPDGFSGCKIFTRMATFPIWMIFFFFEKKLRTLFCRKRFFATCYPGNNNFVTS